MAKRKQKAYEQMDTAELAAATAEYDQPWTGEKLPGKPLTGAQRAQHKRASARAKAGRPKIGGGAQIVPVSIERGLLKQVDAYAQRHHLKRSKMVAEGLRLVLQRRAV
jgi:hypothetical protein